MRIRSSKARRLTAANFSEFSPRTSRRALSCARVCKPRCIARGISVRTDRTCADVSYRDHPYVLYKRETAAHKARLYPHSCVILLARRKIPIFFSERRAVTKLAVLSVDKQVCVYWVRRYYRTRRKKRTPREKVFWISWASIEDSSLSFVLREMLRSEMGLRQYNKKICIIV